MVYKNWSVTKIAFILFMEEKKRIWSTKVFGFDITIAKYFQREERSNMVSFQPLQNAPAHFHSCKVEIFHTFVAKRFSSFGIAFLSCVAVCPFTRGVQECWPLDICLHYSKTWRHENSKHFKGVLESKMSRFNF